jgi:6-pyruvoyltetrahydropterin/6-carboxytetrahydropterin synthase
MYEITVEADFSAAHAIVIAGTREPVHGHNWHVVVTIAGDALDPDGLLCDFHTVQGMLDGFIDPFRNRNLNDTPPFDRTNPTAELVAKHLGDRLAESLNPSLAPAAWVASVRVTEAVRCRATYHLRRPL